MMSWCVFARLTAKVTCTVVFRADPHRTAFGTTNDVIRARPDGDVRVVDPTEVWAVEVFPLELLHAAGASTRAATTAHPTLARRPEATKSIRPRPRRTSRHPLAARHPADRRRRPAFRPRP